MHLHILGIGGTFMAGIARLAVESGHRVSGVDGPLYPPMSTQLDALGIEVHEGYTEDSLAPAPDLVIVGNAISRGNPAFERALSDGLPYASGPEWLKHNVLHSRHVIAVAGTHGKTTVSSLVAWMLEHAGLEPGFLIGGVAENFAVSARLGKGRVFVVEADEYDTALFDKRSKFLHYLPRTLVINNLEFDHADIFENLEAIERQFHHLVRTLPAEALIVRPAPDAAIDAVLAMGCWSRTATFGTDAGCDWRYERTAGDATLSIVPPGGEPLTAPTSLPGAHNAWNVLAAVAAADDVGVAPADALAALAEFRSVKRRLELRGEHRGIAVYDDFAHHPTAIAATIAALREVRPEGRVLAVLEPRSNTMRMGVHADTLADALSGAAYAAVYAPPEVAWNVAAALEGRPGCEVCASVVETLEAVLAHARSGDAILVMSNGAFDNIHERLLGALAESA